MQVRFAGLTRNETGKKGEPVLLPAESSLEELVDHLNEKYRWRLQDDRDYLVILNNHGLERERWPLQKLRPGDVVLVISSLAGG